MKLSIKKAVLSLAAIALFLHVSYGQSCFTSVCPSSGLTYTPIHGFQLPNGTYRILCNERAQIPNLYKPYIVDIDQSGNLLKVTSAGVAGDYGYWIDPVNVTHDAQGNLYYKYRSEVPKYDSLPGGFVKINASGEIAWNDHQTGTRFLVTPLSNGNFVSYNQVGGKFLETLNPMGESIKKSAALAVNNLYPILEYDNSHFVVSDFKNDSMVLYLTNDDGLITKTIGFEVYPEDTLVHGKLLASQVQLFKNDNNIFFLYMKYLPQIGYFRSHLCKMDMNLNTIWDQPVADTSAGASIRIAPISNGGFLAVQTRGLDFSGCPYIGTGGVNFHYIDALGNQTEQFSVSTRGGWSKNDPLGSIAWFQIANITPTADKGLLITCNYSAAEYSWKGTYAAFKTDSNGQICAFPDVAIGEKEPLINEDFSIYPNPIKDNFHIKLPPGVQLSAVQLYDVAGHQVPFDLHTMGVSHLPNGFYYLELNTTGKHQNHHRQKVVVQH